jgi:hypothetical protein
MSFWNVIWACRIGIELVPLDSGVDRGIRRHCCMMKHDSEADGVISASVFVQVEKVGFHHLFGSYKPPILSS